MRAAVLAVMLSVVAGVAAAGEVTVINDKARFPEGPLWLDGKLWYVEYGGHTIMTWDGKANAEFWKQDGCGPSAVVRAGDGSFLVTCYDSGTIARVSADGKTLGSIDKDSDGQALVGPNDFTADGKGGVYFSASGPWESFPIVGKVYHLAADGTVRAVADDLHYANGLAMSPDGRTLYVCESEAYRIVQFAVAADGTLSDRRLFVRLATLAGDPAADLYCDGLEIDRAGNLWIGHYSSGVILQASREPLLLRRIEVPSPAAPNLVLGPDEKTLYVTAVDDKTNPPYMGKVYAVPLQ
jgi:gluconolactonase